MKTLCLLFLLASQAFGRAAILDFDVSPVGTTAGTGLSPLNEVILPNSNGSGGETGTGILFNTDSLILTLSIGYGFFAGFSDLNGSAFSWLLHGPATPVETAPVLFDLASLHTFAPNPEHGGILSGTLTLTPAQANDLIAGLDYINIYTPQNLGGEIRGQLVLVPEPSTTVLLLLAGLGLFGGLRRRRR